MRKFVTIVMGFVGAVAILMILLLNGFWKQVEINYHFDCLRRLRENRPQMIDGGFVIDDSFESASYHRDRLKALGVFFCKTYKLDSFFGSFKSQRPLVMILENRFPENRFWELNQKNELTVWDLKNREEEWDLFIETELAKELAKSK